MRTRAIWPLLAILALAATPLKAQDARSDSAAVLSTLQRFFDAMAGHDSAAVAGLLLPGLQMSSVLADVDTATVSARSGASMLPMIADARHRLLERMWSPVVHVEGPIAVVWTRYDFHVDGRWSHCGTDAVTLLREGETWRISGFSWTVQRAACAPHPAGPPADATGGGAGE